MRFLLLSFLITTQALAYPVFFQCDAEGRLSDQMTTPQTASKVQDLLSSLAKAGQSERQARISEYCQGGAQCMREMRELLQLSEVSGKISADAISSEINRVTETARSTSKDLSALIKVPEGIFSTVNEYNASVSGIALARECRVSMAKLEPELMKNSKEPAQCLLANFHHSPYMYPTGIRISGTANKTGDREQDSPACAAIDDVIRSALVTDHDPFAALAISLMENGSQLAGLSLDPIGTVQTLGCPTSPGTKASHDVSSYGTYYHVKTGLVKNPKLVKNIEDMAKLENVKLVPGKGTVCMPMNPDDENSASTLYSDRAEPGACCVEIPYTKESFGDVEIDKLLTYTSFDKYLNTPLEARINHSDPMEKLARRLQRFNGYSDSMGGAEGVPAWRSGVNFFQTPTYGYQAVDFMMNTLWNNPYVRQKITELESKLGKKSRSVMCQDLSSGAYAIEHDSFFKKHAAAPRMTAIRQRLREAGSFAKLPKRDQQVLKNEILTVCKSDSPPVAFCTPVRKYLKALEKPESEMNDFRDAMDTQDGQYVVKLEALKKKLALAEAAGWNGIDSATLLTNYWRDIYPRRSTMGLANLMDQGFSWGEMNDQQFDSLRSAMKKRNERSEDGSEIKEELGL